VLITYFEYNFQRLLAGIQDFKQFTDRYSIIYSTSWSPTNYHLLASLVAETSGPVWVQACNYGEIPALSAVHPRIRCLTTLPCDWLAPEYYPMAPEQERDIDILVVSNWAPFKRHWALFAALAQLPAHWRVVCVGQPETGSSLAKIQALQTRFGVKQRIEYHERLSIDEVTALQLRSKVGAVFSRHEGCCVAAAETLMAGCSLALIDGAKVGPLAYVTEQTGVAMRSGSISADLARAVEQAHLRSPRQFAEQHVSCLVSAQKLNAQLLSEAAREGRPWTRDIQTPVWRPYPRLLREVPPDIQQAADELSALYPSVFPPTFLNTSHR
jgi:glycosyltransferase involved in cell wall biosynthesis